MNISKLSVKRPIAVTMIVLIFVVIGLYSLTMLPMEMMPEMDLSMALIYTSYPNVGSQEVENLVTKNIESTVSSVSGVNSITSQSSEGTSMVMVQFSNGTDMDKAIQDLKDRVDMVEAFLPDGAEEPMVMKLDTSMMPVAMMSVTYEGMDIIQAKKFVEDNVKNKLESVDGVASVNVTGAQDRIIEVEVDPEKLFGTGVSMTDAVTAIASQNANLPAGGIKNGNKEFTSRVVGKFDSVEAINRVPLITPQGQTIYLKDVATVEDTYSEIKTISRLNGETSLAISISPESDANTVDVVDGIVKVLEDLERQYPKFKYEMTMEQASYIKDSVSSVASNAVTGAILAILILLLFLANIRDSLIIGVAMPVSVITTFIGMYFSGMTLNVVSLGGLALGVGMLVDNSVVVLENIFRRRKELGEDSQTSSIRGGAEVFSAVLASVLTTCIVYVPILFIDNMMAVMFKQLAFAIIFSQAAAIIVTYLLVPMLTSKAKDSKPNKKLAFVLKPFDKFMQLVYRAYEKSLRWTLRYRKSFMAVIILIFVVSMIVLGSIGMTLMNASDQGTLTVSIELPIGSVLEDNNEAALEIEKIISDNKNVDKVFSSVGSGGMAALGQSSSNASSITVTLKENRSKTTDEVAQELREAFSDVTGAVVTVSSASAMSSMGTGGMQFEFTGNDDEELEKYVLEAEKVLAKIDGVVETSTSIADKKTEIQILIDSAKASKYGLSTAVVSNSVNEILEGKTAGRYTEGGLEYDIKMKYPDNYVNDVEALRTMRLKTMTGQWITLSDIADVVEKDGYTTLTRIDQKRVITLSAKIFDTDMATVNTAFDEALKDIPVPEGVSKKTGGEFEVMIDAMGSLILAILLGIVLMYMVMAAQFESVSQPFIILFTLPLAMIGVVLGHVIAGMPLSVVSCIGILMLMGIVVNNAIVLIDFMNTARKEKPDASRTELMVHTGLTRIRPVLMTSLTSVLGFLPMALAIGSEGAEMMQPLAISLTGGLMVGTVLTLYVIPVVYTIFDDRKLKKKAKKEAKRAKKAAIAAEKEASEFDA